MQALRKSLHLLNVTSPVCVQVATVMRCKMPVTFDHVEMPEKNRPRIIDKTPNSVRAQIKMPKLLDRMRGPEENHNRLIYGEFGVQALQGGRLRHGHFEAMRIQLVRNMNTKKCFAHYRVDPVWQGVTKKPIGHRGGGGKPNIKYFVTPVKEGRIILEVGGYCMFEEVESILKVIVNLLPFKARVVTRQLLENEKGEEERLAKLNQNPFTFEYCAKNNINNIQRWLSPYDFKYFGRYR
ncbi:mitochondrial ribosomal large subunit component [Mactra antiquata]